MICADARHLIHLDAGGDLHAAHQHSLAEHLEKCSECRGYNSSMVSAMQAMQVLRDFDSMAMTRGEGVSSSAWPAIASRLPVRRVRPYTPRQFNTRVAALCACSLALAVVTIVQNLPLSRMTVDSGFSSMPFGPSAGMNPAMNGVAPSSPLVVPVSGGSWMTALVGTSQQSNRWYPQDAFPPGTRIQLMNPDGTPGGTFEMVPASLPPLTDSNVEAF